MMKVVVIGGGPAGLIAAISAAQENNEVIVLEKMNEVGRKLLITGKGRCNITSNIPVSYTHLDVYKRQSKDNRLKK